MAETFTPTIDAFLLDHHLMSLAVTDGSAPWAANVFYVFDAQEPRLLFFTATTTRHGALLESDGRAAATIAGETRAIARLSGLQLEGRASVLGGAEAEAAHAVFLAKFPEIAGLDAPIWALRPDTIKLTDNARGFGHKEVWSR